MRLQDSITHRQVPGVAPATIIAARPGDQIVVGQVVPVTIFYMGAFGDPAAVFSSAVQQLGADDNFVVYHWDGARWIVWSWRSPGEVSLSMIEPGRFYQLASTRAGTVWTVPGVPAPAPAPIVPPAPDPDPIEVVPAPPPDPIGVVPTPRSRTAGGPWLIAAAALAIWLVTSKQRD